MRRQRLEIAGVAREPRHTQYRRRIFAAFRPRIDARVQPDAVVRPPILVRPVAAAFLLGQYGTSPSASRFARPGARDSPPRLSPTALRGASVPLRGRL